MRGYKVFNHDLTCRDFQFEVGKEFMHPGPIKICSAGFHFCTKANDCFEYYPFNSENIVCEVEALGEVQTHEDDSKVCTNHIRIIRQLSWHEVLDVVNMGKNNTGRGNTGNRNTGYSNTGYRNTGNSNTGDWNTGDSNTGYSNTGNRNTGAFCTGEEKIRLFNKPSDWTMDDFENSRAFYLLRNYVDTKQWVPAYQMTDEEKQAHPSHKTTEGYLKDIPFKESFGNAWHNWSEENRKAFTSLPNFDSKIFFEITGVEA